VRYVKANIYFGKGVKKWAINKYLSWYDTRSENGWIGKSGLKCAQD
jgi:hypothetical protein